MVCRMMSCLRASGTMLCISLNLRSHWSASHAAEGAGGRWKPVSSAARLGAAGRGLMGAAGDAGSGMATVGVRAALAPGARFLAKRPAISRRRTIASVADAESAAAKPISNTVPTQSMCPPPKSR